MKSKANIKIHPLHPILVVFPLAFFTGAFVFDLLALLTNRYSFWLTGYYLGIAGIIGAVLAATAGIIDFIHTVPPESSAKKRAARHGMLNTTVLLLFIISLFIRKSDISANVLIVESPAVVIMFIAGWMGGKLVHRNQIGIYNRYADSGKWSEASFPQQQGPYDVAAVDELRVNHMKLLHVHGRRIVLARTEEGHVAFDDRCSHKGGSLAGGVMFCGTVHCPWHGSLFDVKTGAVKAGPAKEGIRTYLLREENGRVFLDPS